MNSEDKQPLQAFQEGTRPEEPTRVSSGTVSPVFLDLLEACRTGFPSGAQWSHESEDLDVTLLSWSRGRRIEPHGNTEVDVVWLVVEGEGTATLDGKAYSLHPGVMLLIPKGCVRAVESTSERLNYLSLHQRRKGLQLTRFPPRTKPTA